MNKNLYWDGYRYWDGDTAIPTSSDEAKEKGLIYDSATDSYWSGDKCVASKEVVERTRRILTNGTD